MPGAVYAARVLDSPSSRRTELLAGAWPGGVHLPDVSDSATQGRRRVVALVPLRKPGAGKTRLGGGLSPQERAELAAAMLADVAAALRSAPLDRVVVAATGPAAAASAGALGLEILLDPPGDGGLDTAVDAASRHLATAGSLLVVAADLPRLRSGDITAVLDRPEPVVVAPTLDGGTAALLRRPPRAIPSAYGAGSAARHLALAAEAGLAAATIDRAGLRHDVDTWADLRGLVHGDVGAATASFLERIRPRLEAAG